MKNTKQTCLEERIQYIQKMRDFRAFYVHKKNAFDTETEKSQKDKLQQELDTLDMYKDANLLKTISIEIVTYVIHHGLYPFAGP